MDTEMLLWLDLETTGLEPVEDHILEVAWQLTGPNLNSLTELRSYVITPSIETWSIIEDDAFIQDMHGNTGLLDDLALPTTKELGDVEQQIIDALGAINPTNEPVYLAGASVHFDHDFICNWMPDLNSMLSHRVYDTSTLKAFFGSLGIDHGVVNENQHRAADDVVETLEVARNYREWVHTSKSLVLAYVGQGDL